HGLGSTARRDRKAPDGDPGAPAQRLLRRRALRSRDRASAAGALALPGLRLRPAPDRRARQHAGPRRRRERGGPAAASDGLHRQLRAHDAGRRRRHRGVSAQSMKRELPRSACLTRAVPARIFLRPPSVLSVLPVLDPRMPARIFLRPPSVLSVLPVLDPIMPARIFLRPPSVLSVLPVLDP